PCTTAASASAPEAPCRPPISNGPGPAERRRSAASAKAGSDESAASGLPEPPAGGTRCPIPAGGGVPERVNSLLDSRLVQNVVGLARRVRVRARLAVFDRRIRGRERRDGLRRIGRRRRRRATRLRAERPQRLPGGALLGVLLVPAPGRAALLAVHDRGDL